MDKKVKIITDSEGNKIVLINDIRFRGKKREEWNEIEEYLKEYVGKCYEIAEIAANKSISEDYDSKHKNKAKFGWYRYDTRLGLPVYNDLGKLERYNIFKMRMLVRHDSDEKMYLYDFLRTKKETSSPLE